MIKCRVKEWNLDFGCPQKPSVTTMSASPWARPRDRPLHAASSSSIGNSSNPLARSAHQHRSQASPIGATSATANDDPFTSPLVSDSYKPCPYSYQAGLSLPIYSADTDLWYRMWKPSVLAAAGIPPDPQLLAQALKELETVAEAMRPNIDN